MNNLTERPLTTEEKADFQIRAVQTLRDLGVGNAAANSESIVQKVDEFVDKWQVENAPRRFFFSRKSAPTNAMEVALGLGAVWGAQIVRKFGWEWICLNSDSEELECVASPNRGWVIFPAYFLRMCLDNHDADCTVMLSFNMMAAGNIPENAANSYENLMNGVHRVIPKR